MYAFRIPRHCLFKGAKAYAGILEECTHGQNGACITNQARTWSLQDVFGLGSFHDFLGDSAAVVALCRDVAPARQALYIRFFQVEKEIRRRATQLRGVLGMPGVLDVWAEALRSWRVVRLRMRCHVQTYDGQTCSASALVAFGIACSKVPAEDGEAARKFIVPKEQHLRARANTMLRTLTMEFARS